MNDQSSTAFSLLSSPDVARESGGGSRKCRGELLRLEELSFGVIIGGYTVSVGKMVLEAVVISS